LKQSPRKPLAPYVPPCVPPCLVCRSLTRLPTCNNNNQNIESSISQLPYGGYCLGHRFASHRIASHTPFGSTIMNVDHRETGREKVSEKYSAAYVGSYHNGHSITTVKHTPRGKNKTKEKKTPHRLATATVMPTHVRLCAFFFLLLSQLQTSASAVGVIRICVSLRCLFSFASRPSLWFESDAVQRSFRGRYSHSPVSRSLR
jgi:hypothetical protein